MTERYRVIMDAYEVALAGRDPSSVRIEDLLPTIFDALPGVTIPEVCAALRWRPIDPLFRADGPRTSHAQAQMDERRENDRDFPIDARIAGRSRRFCSAA